jgi:hypothetical protein
MQVLSREVPVPLPSGEVGMSDDVGHELVLPFDSDDPEFCRGFECGRMWEAVKHGPCEFTIASVNAEMVLRIAEAAGMKVEAIPDPIRDWITVVFS